MFIVSAFSFFMLFVTKEPIINIFFLALANLTNGGAATMLWSVYCPSLRDTGMVSGATGYLDFLSYSAAAAANAFFTSAVTNIGWSWMIIIWAGIMTAGVIISLPFKRKIK